MATLARALLRDFPHYYPLFSVKRFDYRGRVYTNHNRLLRRYSGADGLKTGYIRASGYNVVISAERHNRRLIGVVTGGKTAKARDALMARLLDRAYARIAGPGLSQVPKAKPVMVAWKDAARRLATSTRKRDTFERDTSLTRFAEAKRKPVSQGRWGIQVGAFKRYPPAHLAVTRAAEAFPKLLSQTEVAILSAEHDAGTLYRARLTDMSEHRARTACRLLALRNFDCSLVPPGSELPLASN